MIYDHLSHRGAVFSDCMKYRYTLTRKFETSLFHSTFKRIAFIMFNPSTASAEVDDPTIRRVMNFAYREDCHSLVILNLIPFITSKPSELDPNTAFGAGRNIEQMIPTLLDYPQIVVAWGAIGEGYQDIFIKALGQLETCLADLAFQMKRESFFDGKFYCLGTTESGHPKHPLYLKKDQPLEPFDIQQYFRKHNVFTDATYAEDQTYAD